MSQFPPISSMSPLGGRYRLREPLGEGTFAVTYLAEDLVLGRQVAVKILRARYGADAAAAARFEREARAAASVSSPYIVDVFDYGTDQGSSYIVLQYVPGPTLRDVINQAGRLAPRDAVRIAIDILRGLAVIHDAGIIHRDVKPHNVLIDRNGTARVTDFGVALWAGTETLTSHGMAVGTAVYMAPEQARGVEVTRAADLYAVGVLLFEMLTGQPPFRADNPTTLMLAHVQQEPPLPSEIAPALALPVALEREVMRALAKEPRDRRPSARDMALALEAAATGAGATEARDPIPSSQGATTATIPAVGSKVPTATSADATAIAPAARLARTSRSRAWLGPLALLLIAVVILGVISVNGGFRGLAGLFDPPADPNIAAVVTETLVPSPTAGAGSVAPPAATSSGRQLFPDVGNSGVTPTPATTVLAPTEPPVATSTPAPPPTPSPAATVESISVDPTEVPAAPIDENRDPSDAGSNASQDGSSLQFGPGDWQGAGAADPELGRPAVALYGAEGAASRALLQFDLASTPAGPMVLTITGLGDETGMAFPFGIEVNGMYAGQSPSTFDNWHPARDGLNGEQATWDQVRIILPPEVFHAGDNQIAIVSLAPGDYDDRVPYLLLSDATLAPE